MIGDSGPRTTLLPGAPAEASPSPEGPPSQETPASASPSAARSRTPLLIVAGAGVLVLAAVAAFVGINKYGLLNNGLLTSGGGDVSTGTVPTPAVRPTSPSASASGSPALPSGSSASGSSPSGSTASTPAAVPTGRNPFLPPSGAAVPVVPGSSAGTASASSSSTASQTATVAASPVYVGLYGFSGSKAVFWVNDTKYSVSTGGTFSGFTYTSKTSGGCAKVLKSGTTTTICPGTVKQLE